MEKLDRVQKLHRTLKSGSKHSQVELAKYLDCSPETVKRLIVFLRDYFGAPISFDRANHGYCYIDKDLEKFELPNLWLTANEVHSLAVILNILRDMDNALLADDIEQMNDLLKNILKSLDINPNKFCQKVQYLPTHKNPLKSETFSTVTEALLKEKNLLIKYLDYRARLTERIISPLKIVYYQSNWYLDAWCHKRKALRSFMVSRIKFIEVKKESIIKISAKELREYFAESYGIFAGKAKHQVKIRFFEEAAHEAASQQWHPMQNGKWQNNCYILSFPYSDDRELIRDILAFGSYAEVLAPVKLKNKIKNTIRGMQEIYR